MMDSEVIVVGAGVVGLWTAYYLRKQGVKTLLLEQFSVPHARGSSHGESRIIRTAYSKEEYVKFLPESYRGWRTLERESAERLLVVNGMIWAFNMKTSADSFRETLKNTKKYAPNHEILSGDKVQDTFPCIKCDLDYQVIWDKEAGILNAAACLRVLMNLFVKNGGIFRDNERVNNIRPISDTEVEVNCNKQTFRSKSVVLACGPYINHLLQVLNYKIPVQTIKAPFFYWKEKEGFDANADNCPTVVVEKSSFYWYCIPKIKDPGELKISYRGFIPVDPTEIDKVTPAIAEQEKEKMTWLKNQIRSTLPSVDISGPEKTEICMYTYSKDRSFVLDRLPMHRNVVVGSGFSGHGFKTAPAVGHILANMALGLESPYPLEPFKCDWQKLTISNL